MLRQVRKITSADQATLGRDAAFRDVSSAHIPTSDELLDTFARTGSPADFEQIVQRFAAIVLMECRKVTRNPHDAEDASQLTFLALAMELKLGKKIQHPSAWLQRVARNQSIKIIRSGTRRTRRENIVRKNDFVPNNELSLDASHNSGIIRDQIDQLPDRYRLPLVLHYFGGMSMEMISREMQIGKQTVGTRLHRARKMLGTKLAGHGIHLDATLLSNLLGIVVPSAVIASIVRATSAGVATHATIGPAAVALPASMGYFLSAASITATQKAIRAALLSAALGIAGTAVANKVAPGLLKLPTLQLPKVSEWFNRAPQLFPKFSPMSSRAGAFSIVSPTPASGGNVRDAHGQDSKSSAITFARTTSLPGQASQQMTLTGSTTLSISDSSIQKYVSDAHSIDLPTVPTSGYPEVFNYFASTLPTNAAAFYQTSGDLVAFLGGDGALSLASTSPVPEPAVTLPLTAGAGLLIARRRRTGGNTTTDSQRS